MQVQQQWLLRRTPFLCYPTPSHSKYRYHRIVTVLHHNQTYFTKLITGAIIYGTSTIYIVLAVDVYLIRYFGHVCLKNFQNLYVDQNLLIYTN